MASLYKELAKYYDLIYSQKDYKKESEDIVRLISQYKKTDGKDLLDVACGTGRHLQYLKGRFSCMGVDLSQEMLDIAKKNTKGVTFKRANMVTMDLGRRFDVVLCLFSAIGHVKTYDNLRKSIRSFHHHLNPGGVLILDAWMTSRQWIAGSVHMKNYDTEDLKIAKVGYSGIRGGLSVLEEHYLVAEKGKGVKHYLDVDEMGLFDDRKTMAILRNAGFRPTILKGVMMDRDRYVAVKE